MNAESSSTMKPRSWHILLTKPYNEVSIKRWLDELNVSNFLPVKDSELCWKGKIIRKKEIVIPRVIFVYADKDLLTDLLGQLHLCRMSLREEVHSLFGEADNLEFFFSKLDSSVVWIWNPDSYEEKQELITLTCGKLQGLKGYICPDRENYLRVPCCGLGNFIVKFDE